MTKYMIDWKIEGKTLIVAATPEEAQEKFDALDNSKIAEDGLREQYEVYELPDGAMP